MSENTGATCVYEQEAGIGNDTGHALEHMLHSVAVMSAVQSVRTAVTAAAAGVLVAFLFTRNWWVFALLVIVAVVDIYVHRSFLAAQRDLSQWYHVTAEASKKIFLRGKVLETLVKGKDS